MAENLNVTRTLVAEAGDGADRAALPDWQATRRKPLRGPRLSAKGQLTVTLLIVMVVVALLAFLWAQWQVLDAEVPAATMFVRLMLLVVTPVLAIAGLAQWLWYRAQHSRIVRLENDHPAAIDHVLSGRLPAAESLAAFYQVQGVWAANSGLRSLNQLDMSSTKAPEKLQDAPALPAPGLDLVDAGDWLRWLNDEAPHVLLAGPSGSGKTTAAKALLSGRVARGDTLCIVDPHARPDAWPVAAYGAGRDYAQIADTFEALLAELDARYKRYRDGRDDFDRLTIVVDEVPAIAAHLNAAWTRFFRATGSEARKVRMSVILISQSALIKDIGSSTSMRENYARLGFGTAAGDVLREERDTERRRQLDPLLADRPHVAALEWRGRVHALDLTRVPLLASERPGQAEPWQPDPCSVPFREGPDPLLSALLDGTRNAEQASERDARAIALFRAGHTFRDVAEQIRNDGYTIANAELLDLRRQALNDAAA